MLLAKSSEHNPCGKVCSCPSAKLDNIRTYVLIDSTVMHSIGCVSHLSVTSPTVSTLHEALLVKWAFASVTADSRSELGPCWHGCEGCSHHLTSGRIR